MSEAIPPFPTHLYGAVNMRFSLLGNAVLRVYRMLNYGQQVEKQLVQSQAGIMNKFMYVSTIQPVNSSTGSYRKHTSSKTPHFNTLNIRRDSYICAED